MMTYSAQYFMLANALHPTQEAGLNKLQTTSAQTETETINETTKKEEGGLTSETTEDVFGEMFVFDSSI